MKKIRLFVKKILKDIWLKLGKTYKGTKKFVWEHRQGIQIILTLATVLLFLIAIWISYRTLGESQKFGTTMIAQMDTLSTLFTKVNEQISYLPTSVSRFDSTVRGLNEGISNQQEEFQRSISGLQRNVDSFSKGIADYGRILAKIVEASDKQLVLLDERQKLLEKELMRKPKLILRVKQCRRDTLDRDKLIITPEIVNKGDAIAEYSRILIWVPKEFEFSSGGGYNVYDSGKQMQTWSYDFPSFIGYSVEKKDYPVVSSSRMKFSIKVSSRFKFPYEIDYVIFHNKGEDRGKLTINPADCN